MPLARAGAEERPNAVVPNIHRLASLPITVRTEAIVSQILGHPVFDTPGQIRRGFRIADASPGTPTSRLPSNSQNPSAIRRSLFGEKPEEFYVRYLADHPAPRLPQEPPMAVGSAFDAYVKAAINHALYGTATPPQFEFGAIFENQVEPQNRDFALKAGKHVFKAYKLCGAFDDLMKLLRQSVEPPRFETKVDGTIAGAHSRASPIAVSCSTSVSG